MRKFLFNHLSGKHAVAWMTFLIWFAFIIGIFGMIFASGFSLAGCLVEIELVVLSIVLLWLNKK